MSKIKETLKKNKPVLTVYSWIFRKLSEILTLISPTVNTKFLYRHNFHKKLDLNNPVTLNEKLLWLKLNKYMTNPLVIQCADKYLVREYIEKCGCTEILNELYGVYKTPDEIVWEDLPDKFALKWNFGAGFNIICNDKASLDEKEIKRKLKKWGKSKCWLAHSEMQYKYIPKRIVCEKYLEPENGRLPEDYKVYCFNGKAEFVMICVGREHGHPKFYFVDRDWNLCRINKDSRNAPENFSVPKPACVEHLFECAEKLSAPFPFVRADFYIVDKKVIFGELTFTPAGALDSNRLQETDVLMGSMVDLPK